MKYIIRNVVKTCKSPKKQLRRLKPLYKDAIKKINKCEQKMFKKIKFIIKKKKRFCKLMPKIYDQIFSEK